MNRLFFEPLIFVEKALYVTKRKLILNKISFIFLNIFSIILTFSSLSMTTIVLSKIIQTEIPDWFFYVTTMFSALVSFITSLLNFFYIKVNINKLKKTFVFINTEIVRYFTKQEIYKNTNNRDMEIFNRVSSYLDYQLDWKEENE